MTAVRIDAPAAAPAARLPLVDMARGAAIVAMIVYHAAWDLSFFRLIPVDVGGSLGWSLFARAIAGSILAVVGISLVLATRRGLHLARFVRRLAILVAAAASITLVTWFVFPDSFIFFGILHSIAVASVLGLAFVRLPVAAVALAAAAVFVAPAVIADPVLDEPALWWLGLMSFRPLSNDFVPIFPWFGMVLAGIVAARLALRFGFVESARPRPGRPLALLVWVGRHSLVIYLIHQPVLFGLAALAAQAIGPASADPTPAFVESCTAGCMESGTGEAICRPACECLAADAKLAGLWPQILADRLSIPETERYGGLARECRNAVGAP